MRRLCGARWNRITAGVASSGMRVRECAEKARQACLIHHGGSNKGARSCRTARRSAPSPSSIGALLRSHWEYLNQDWQSGQGIDKRITPLAILTGHDGSPRACNLARGGGKAPATTLPAGMKSSSSPRSAIKMQKSPRKNLLRAFDSQRQNYQINILQ